MKTIQTERLFIKTFANDSSLFKNLDVAEVKLKTLNRLFNLEILAMTLICTPIANQRNLTVSRSYLHSRHLKLADLFDNKKHIEMLKGVDYYHSLLLDEIIRGNENGPFPVNSHIEWIVSGSFKHVRFPRADKKTYFFVKNKPFNQLSNDYDLNDHFHKFFQSIVLNLEVKKMSFQIFSRN